MIITSHDTTRPIPASHRPQANYDSTTLCDYGAVEARSSS